jgi:hypothetical protein
MDLRMTQMTNDRFDDALSRHFVHQSADDAAAARVLNALAQPLPRQKIGIWKRLPVILLDWQFAPAWPRVAALAACAALGFFIGIAGFDARIDDANAQNVIAASDLSAGFFEAEPLTGLRP